MGSGRQTPSQAIPLPRAEKRSGQPNDYPKSPMSPECCQEETRSCTPLRFVALFLYVCAAVFLMVASLPSCCHPATALAGFSDGGTHTHTPPPAARRHVRCCFFRFVPAACALSECCCSVLRLPCSSCHPTAIHLSFPPCGCVHCATHLLWPGNVTLCAPARCGAPRALAGEEMQRKQKRSQHSATELLYYKPN